MTVTCDKPMTEYLPVRCYILRSIFRSTFSFPPGFMSKSQLELTILRFKIDFFCSLAPPFKSSFSLFFDEYLHSCTLELLYSVNV